MPYQVVIMQYVVKEDKIVNWSYVYWDQHMGQYYNILITIAWRLDGSIIIIPSHG